MSETREILAKIGALRQRLAQAQGLAHEARSAAAALMGEVAEAGEAIGTLEQAVEEGTRRSLALDNAVKPLTDAVADAPPAVAPSSLSGRARRVLERGRELLAQLRSLAEIFVPGDGPVREVLPLTFLYRDTVAMIDTALRTVALMPESVTSQMHLCRGLEVTLEEVAGRLSTLLTGTRRKQVEDGKLIRLATALIELDAGRPIDVSVLHQLAEEILDEARDCEPIHFVEGNPLFPPQFVACHSLNVARILARVVRHDPELRTRPHDVVLAGLLHDVGMVGVPASVLSQTDPLGDDERRVIEGHAVVGSQLMQALFPDSPWLAEAIAGHHERLDGTGYPDGLKGNRVRSLARLLAVADVYAALCAARPHRSARPTRTALADTLLLADAGQLDRSAAEYLLSLSFYPVGSVVELSHGPVGVVVATPRGRVDAPARPVVALLTDADGEPLPRPHHLDLGQSDVYSVVRTLSPLEKAELLGRRFPRWAA